MPMDCPNKLKGCDVRPTRADLERHRELCPFSIAAMEEQRSEKNKQLRARMKEVLNANKVPIDSLCELAKDLYDVGDYPSANEVAKQAISLAKSSKNISVEVQATFLVALVDQCEARYDHALFLFEEARQLAVKNGNDKAKIADCLFHLGEIYMKTGKYTEAENNCKAALALVNELGNGVLQGELFNFLGLIAKKRSDYDRAISYYRDAMRVVGAEQPIWFEIVSNLADVYRKKENFKEARELYTQALNKLKELHGNNHPQIAEISNALGMLNKKEGKYDEALGFYKTALQIGKFFFGANHPSIGIYLTNLGDIYRKQGNFNKAEGIYSQALPMLEKSLGKNHAEVAEVLNSMGLVLKKRADYDGAEQLAISIIEKTFSKTHYKIGIYLNNLADTERKRARFKSALDMYKQALVIIEKNLGPTHSEAAEILFNMGLVEHQQENYAEAIKLFLNAYRIVEKELGARHYKIGMILNNLGLAEMMKNNYDRLSILLECLGRDHVEVADCYINLGDVCMKLTQEKNQNQIEAAKKNCIIY